ncbi:MAG: PKD domain-containing protein [Methanobacteriota archaeon]
MRKIRELRKIIACSLGILLLGTAITSLVVAQNIMDIACVEPSEPAISVSDHYVDPDRSFIQLTNENLNGLSTCPVGDGPAYHFLKVTVLDEYGVPLSGIKSDEFKFTVTADVGTVYTGTLTCTFIPFGPTVSTTATVATNNLGEILFKIVGDTTIIGVILIEVTVCHTTINDQARLPCKSFDINHDDVVDCVDFDIFAIDYRHESGAEVWRSDFDWDNDVDLGDFVMFAAHVEGPCEQNYAPIIPHHPEPKNGYVDVPYDTNFCWGSGDNNRDDTVTYVLYIGTDPAEMSQHLVGTYVGDELRICFDPEWVLAFGTTYYWKINATDSHGASSESPLWSFTTAFFIDTEPPSGITGLTVTDAHDGKLDITWDEATDNVAVDYYVLSRDGMFLVQLETPGYLDTGLTNGQTYTYKVYAVDTSGNEGDTAVASGTPTGSNHAPDQPTNPSPANGANEVDTSPTLSVTVSDPDGDSMDIRFYNAAGDQLIGVDSAVSSGDTASVTWSGLQSSSQYSWYAVADDSQLQTTSNTWSFTTAGSSSGGHSSGGGGRPSSGVVLPNQPPIADASAGEPYREIVGCNIVFDGSLSHDPDGRIVSLTWDFGDGTTGIGQTVPHSYENEGTYAVSLVVVDNQGDSGLTSTSATVISQNSAPSIPEIISLTGSTTVKTRTVYMYIARSTDANHDLLQYVFDWGDGTTDESTFIISGTPYVVGHSWSEPGTYTITVSASDQKTSSSASISVVAQDEPAGVPVENIILVIFALLALLLLFLLLFILKRRKKHQ